MHAMLAYIVAMGLVLLALAMILIAQGLIAAYPKRAPRFGRYLFWGGITLAAVSLVWLGIMLFRYLALLSPTF